MAGQGEETKVTTVREGQGSGPGWTRPEGRLFSGIFARWVWEEGNYKATIGATMFSMGHPHG